MDRHVAGLREGVTSSWEFKSLARGVSSGFPLASHLALPVLSPYLVYLRILLCVYASISQPRWIPGKRLVGKLDITPLLTPKELSSQEDLLNLENVKDVVSLLLSEQGPVSSLDCSASDTLEFLSTANELQMLFLVGAHLLPDSKITWLLCPFRSSRKGS